jgi:hypothetical protein
MDLERGRSGVADVPGRTSSRWNGKYDNAKRQHRQSHELEYQCVKHNNSPAKPIDMSGRD